MRPAEEACTPSNWPADGLQDVPRQQTSADRISVHWKGWLDGDSELARCTFDVLNVADGASVHHMALEPCGDQGTLEISGLLLSHGASYRVQQDMFNGAGLSDSITTEAVYIDTTGPNASSAVVYDEAAEGATVLTEDTDRVGHLVEEPNYVHCSWEGFQEDDASPIRGYQWALTGNDASSDAAPYTANVIPWTPSATSTFVGATATTCMLRTRMRLTAALPVRATKCT